MNPLTPSAKATLALADKVAKQMHHNYIDSGHLLIATLMTTRGISIQLRRSLRLSDKIGARALNIYQQQMSL